MNNSATDSVANSLKTAGKLTDLISNLFSEIADSCADLVANPSIAVADSVAASYTDS